MSRVAVVAYGAVSALGEGPEAVRAVGGAPAPVAIAHDSELARGGLARPFAARAAGADEPGVEARAERLLARALEGCMARLDAIRPSWRSERVGLVLGTSSGGMRAAEIAMRDHRATGDLEAATYGGPVARVCRAAGLTPDPTVVLLAACASSAAAIGLGARLIERDACDLVLAGGFDDVTLFVASGFEALRATTASPPPRPFRLGRDGMCLGEGAGVVALADGAPSARVFVAGFGMTCDARHLTAPDPRGSGVIRAAAAALRESAAPGVDLVSPHGTATPFNDPAEARALATLLPGQAPVVHPLKAQIGHTLGAAGALETLACVEALERGLLPASAGAGAMDPEAAVRLLDRTEAGAPITALKLASAFGGANVALVIARRLGQAPRSGRPAYVRRAVAVEGDPPLDLLAALTARPVEQLGRADGLTRLVLAAAGALERRDGSLASMGIVVGTWLATLATNDRFAARLRERGARAVEPRLFPYTSPNVCAGEAAVAFSLSGPGMAVGGSPLAALEAMAVATWLVQSGDADAMVVVGADEGSPVARALAGDAAPSTRAIATIVSSSPTGAVAQVGAISLQRGTPPEPGGACGADALAPLLDARPPERLEAIAPPDGRATVDLRPT